MNVKTITLFNGSSIPAYRVEFNDDHVVYTDAQDVEHTIPNDDVESVRPRGIDLSTGIFPSDVDDDDAMEVAIHDNSYMFPVSGSVTTNMVNIFTDEGDWQADALIHKHENGSVALQYVVSDGKEDSQPSQDTKQALAEEYFNGAATMVEADVWVAA